MKKFLFSLFLFQSILAGANTYQVGSTKTYISPNALYAANVLQDGDIIEIDAETYTGQAALAVWQADNLLIKGIGGQPHLVANGQYIWGKGIWVLAGNNITVENIEFSGATVPDKNGAGIRLDGIGLTIRHCFFHDNENGILTNNPYDGDILIEYSEFAGNGFSDGYSHNLYIGHVNKLTFQFNYSHHAKIGHTLKSRANENYILYNRIMDEETGYSSRLVDLPNGGFSIIMGNLFMQGPNAENNNMVGYGKEGLSNTTAHELHFINNTLVNKRIGSCLFLDLHNGTTVANITNNIFAGSDNVINGTTGTLNNNIIETNIDHLLFVDEANYNYELSVNSPAIDAGMLNSEVNGYSLTPDYAYAHPLAEMDRGVVNSVIDVGAFEFGVFVAALDQPTSSLTIAPNPTLGYVTIDAGEFQIERIAVFNALGLPILFTSHSKGIDLAGAVKGVYYLTVKWTSGASRTQVIIKE